MTDRGIYVGGYRMGHCVLGLHFDHYLENLGQTYIITNISENHYKDTFPKHDLDWNKFTYVMRTQKSYIGIWKATTEARGYDNKH